MREEIEAAIAEALETATETPAFCYFEGARRPPSRKARGLFLLRLRRLLENLPPDLTLDDLREEIADREDAA